MSKMNMFLVGLSGGFWFAFTDLVLVFQYCISIYHMRNAYIAYLRNAYIAYPIVTMFCAVTLLCTAFKMTESGIDDLIHEIIT